MEASGARKAGLGSSPGHACPRPETLTYTAPLSVRRLTGDFSVGDALLLTRSATSEARATEDLCGGGAPGKSSPAIASRVGRTTFVL